MWESRCYFDGIPDGEEVPALLVNSHRVPSYKKIALAILNNDHKLKSLGFSVDDSDLSNFLKSERASEMTGQYNLF